MKTELMVSEVDVHQARIQLTGAQVSVETFKRLRAQTENAISLLLGRPPMSIPRGLSVDDQRFPPEVPAGLPSELVERRPDIRQAEQLLAAQTARIGVAEAARFPSLTLSADLGASVTSVLDAGAWSVGLDLFGPLFQAGKNKRRVERGVGIARCRHSDGINRTRRKVVIEFWTMFARLSRALRLALLNAS